MTIYDPRFCKVELILSPAPLTSLGKFHLSTLLSLKWSFPCNVVKCSSYAHISLRAQTKSSSVKKNESVFIPCVFQLVKAYQQQIEESQSLEESKDERGLPQHQYCYFPYLVLETTL